MVWRKLKSGLGSGLRSMLGLGLGHSVDHIQVRDWGSSKVCETHSSGSRLTLRFGLRLVLMLALGLGLGECVEKTQFRIGLRGNPH